MMFNLILTNNGGRDASFGVDSNSATARVLDYGAEAYDQLPSEQLMDTLSDIIGGDDWDRYTVKLVFDRDIVGAVDRLQAIQSTDPFTQYKLLPVQVDGDGIVVAGRSIVIPAIMGG